ncbi:MAG: restriction endonuclease subunit S [Vicinamibacterales bacterium]|nr:restriction endonuclease subunit S [Vicinamibacterales bacterium]
MRETIYGDFAADFAEDLLANLCDSRAGIQTGPFGSQLHQEDYVAVGTPIITVEHLGENRILHEGVPRVSDEDRGRLSRYSLREGDIVFSRVGSVDRRALVRRAEDGWLFSGRCLRVRPNTGKIDSGFLSYFFGLPAFKEHIRAIAVGATMPSLNTSILSDVVILHPHDIDEQRAIAHILGTLDDKIELNRRMNETLDGMARSLFKSWFVDFDPVRAKAEGRDPGLPKPLSDLFPDSFEDSELGEIPKGWEIGTLADFSSLNPEAWSKETRPDVINYVDLSNTKWGRIEAVSAYAQQDAPSRAQRVLRSGDTIVGTVRPGNGSYAFISEDGLTASTGFAVLRPLRVEYAEFVYFLATAAQNIEALSHLADGGAYPAVRPGVVAATQVIKSSDDVIDRYSHVAKPQLAKMAENERESRTLAALRDALLPKLISGELRVAHPKTLAEAMQ